jgi:hypothetical protein
MIKCQFYIEILEAAAAKKNSFPMAFVEIKKRNSALK